MCEARYRPGGFVNGWAGNAADVMHTVHVVCVVVGV